MKKRFGVEQRIRILREAEGAVSGSEIARKYNISEQTFYRWKRKYGGMDISEASPAKGGIEDESARLKNKLAEAILENDLLKEINSRSGNPVAEAAGDQRTCTGEVLLDSRSMWLAQALEIELLLRAEEG